MDLREEEKEKTKITFSFFFQRLGELGGSRVPRARIRRHPREHLRDHAQRHSLSGDQDFQLHNTSDLQVEGFIDHYGVDYSLDQRDEYGHSPAHWMALNGHTHVCRLGLMHYID